jgi:hypothetical protein
MNNPRKYEKSVVVPVDGIVFPCQTNGIEMSEQDLVDAIRKQARSAVLTPELLDAIAHTWNGWGNVSCLMNAAKDGEFTSSGFTPKTLHAALVRKGIRHCVVVELNALLASLPASGRRRELNIPVAGIKEGADIVGYHRSFHTGAIWQRSAIGSFQATHDVGRAASAATVFTPLGENRCETSIDATAHNEMQAIIFSERGTRRHRKEPPRKP